MRHSLLFCFLITLACRVNAQEKNDTRFVTFITDPSRIELYWKDDDDKILRSLADLKRFVEQKHRQLQFAMNGGMYLRDNTPQGLFIQNDSVIKTLDTLSGSGNFYLKPNGVFYITDLDKAIICPTQALVSTDHIKFATQSGPMLVIEGNIHPAFKKGSTNLNIRNGVGVLPDGSVLFAMSKKEINFYDFAEFFLQNGCKNALYLDGFVSRMYLPEKKWEQLDGNFGVIIGVTQRPE